MVVEPVDFYGMSPEDILKYLPRKNCGGCGKSRCEEFAGSLSKGESEIKECPEIGLEMKRSLEGGLSIRLEVHEADFTMSTVSEQLIPVNDPTPDSPVLVTGNSNVTLYVLRLIFERAPNVSAWIIPTDTKGFTIDHVMSMGVMTPMTVMNAISTSGIVSRVNSKIMIIPGLCEGLERKIETITKWKVIVGPKSGFELPAYLTQMAEEN
ncbi:MAG: hypothetical protein LBP82_03690 [Candidatus Methanoplasma sp.]|jgi:acetyl-CoA decarbonylase/synthase complex subunit gamma|nr:hypothetical protein [Candidatus Methanoplasma sp.]